MKTIDDVKNGGLNGVKMDNVDMVNLLIILNMSDNLLGI